MKLDALTEGLQYTLLQGTMEKDVNSLIYFSDEAEAGSAFFAIPGSEKNGLAYVQAAQARGADVFLVQESLFLDSPQNPQSRPPTVLLVEDVRKALALMSSRFYGNPCDSLFTVAVTGTKGKTSTTYMLRAVLEEAGIRTGLIGTVENGWEGHFQEAERTTPQSLDVQRWCRQMADGGCRAVIMEVSSQGLMQSRVYGVPFDLGIFTNLSPDHIGPGEHESFEEYAYWKSTLFSQCRTAVILEDEPAWRELLEVRQQEARQQEERQQEANCGDILPQRVLSFGQQAGSDFRCSHLELTKDDIGLGTSFLLEERCSQTERKLSLGLPGLFQAFNAAGAAAAARSCGIGWTVIEEALKKVRVPGRVEPVDTGGKTCVLVDYAHNGLALRQLLRDLRVYEPRQLIVVFGCGGNRDRNRRKEMGRAAAELADLSIVTSDNPRKEKPETIIADIVHAMEEVRNEGRLRGSWQTVENRAEAIREAVRLGEKDDIVLIAGKGHETYQLTGEKKIHFDDREIVRDYIMKIHDFQDHTGENRT
ncbi:MAG: UDP-N-acetylmuramoyl-L-alanyl-D-glutamate--2,6-diaminopimelate ligase [Anaerovoracaceae bacterium]